MSTQYRRLVAPALGALFVSGIASQPLAVAITPDEVQLRFEAEAPNRGYWKLRLRPGETESLTAKMTNTGEDPIRAATFPANVSTAVDGGLEIADDKSKPSGTTRWLDYGKEVLTLAPQEPVSQPFSVTVPRGTAPGDYTTAVVLQNAEPALPAGPEGQIQFGQILRTALTVNIRVPGPYRPALAIDGPQLIEKPASSTVRVKVLNDGNQDLAPAWESDIRDASGNVVAQARGKMDAFYAGTSSSLELNVAGFLVPGVYSVNATMTDPHLDAPVNKMNMPLQIGDPPTAAGDDPTVVNASRSWVPMVVGAVGILLLLLIGALVIRRWRRKRIPRAPAAPPRRPMNDGVLPVASTGAEPEPAGPMGPVTVSTLLPTVGSRLKGLTGDTSVVLREMAALYPGVPGALSVASRPQDIPAVRETGSSAVLVTPEILASVLERGTEGLPTLLAVEDPEAVMRQVAGAFQ